MLVAGLVVDERRLACCVLDVLDGDRAGGCRGGDLDDVERRPRVAARALRDQFDDLVGRFAAQGEAPKTIFISDPVAGVNYSLDPAGKVAVVKREIDGEVEVLEVDLPAVFTAQKGLAEARYPGLKGIMAAKKKPLEERPLPAAPPRTEVRSLSLPPGRAGCTKVPATPEAVRGLLATLRARGVL